MTNIEKEIRKLDGYYLLHIQTKNKRDFKEIGLKIEKEIQDRNVRCAFYWFDTKPKEFPEILADRQRLEDTISGMKEGHKFALAFIRNQRQKLAEKDRKIADLNETIKRLEEEKTKLEKNQLTQGLAEYYIDFGMKKALREQKPSLTAENNIKEFVFKWAVRGESGKTRELSVYGEKCFFIPFKAIEALKKQEARHES